MKNRNQATDPIMEAYDAYWGKNADCPVVYLILCEPVYSVGDVGNVFTTRKAAEAWIKESMKDRPLSYTDKWEYKIHERTLME